MENEAMRQLSFLEEEKKSEEIGKTENTEFQIRHIKKGDPLYPARLLPYPGMPKELWVIGELPDDRPTVAIVGARLCTHYGHVQATEFGRILSSKGVQIVSGMAIGIDSYAQEGALISSGKTYAVLGCGVDVCYPKSNRVLYRKIAQTGGIISELAPGTQPLRPYFPERNRIISALSDIVLVVEAREKSGSLITADCALEQGKTVYALPGRVGDALSGGCNYLIAQGAGIAYSPEAILDELGIMHGTYGTKAFISGKKNLHTVNPSLSRAACMVYKEITSDPQPLSSVIEKSRLSVHEVTSALLELEISDLIDEPSPRCYVLHYEPVI